jgi:UDP-N-acetylmuramoylalanine--D-glutamate ligase
MKKDSLAILYNSEDTKGMVADLDLRVLYFSKSEIESGCYLRGDDLSCRFNNKDGDYKNIVGLSRNNKIPIINIMATLSFAFAFDLKVDTEKLTRDFSRLPFRIEFVCESDGIKYYNDSAATNPISTIEAMKTVMQKYVLIMGGSSKNLKFDELADFALQDKNIVAVYLIGETAHEIQDELLRVGFKKPIIMAGNLDVALGDIKRSKDRFEAVVFSPASASFDQFKNYKDRGEYFNKLVLGE